LHPLEKRRLCTAHAKIGRQTAAGKIGTDAMSWNGSKTELLWGRIHAGQGVFVSMDVF
jgi:hypothetical protein